MALQVWLPLDGNLDNKGLTPISIINNTGTSTANGKTGSCYSYSGAASSYTTYSGFSADGLNELTVCCWACPTNTNVNYLFGMNYISGTSNYYQFSIYNNNNLYVRDSKTGRTSTAKQFYVADSNNPIVAGEWVHLCFTYKSGNVAVYRNGNLVDSGVTQEGSYLNSSITAYIFGGSNISSSSTARFNGKICDFRVYDHALSAKEVREVSRGLIVHYPLCTRESIFTKYSNVTWNQLATNGDFSLGIDSNDLPINTTAQVQLVDGCLVLKKTSGSSGGQCRFPLATSISTSKKYYIKATLKSNDGATSAYFGFASSSWTVNNNNQISTTSSEFVTLSDVVQPTTSSAYFILRIGSSSSATNGKSLTCKNIMCIDLTTMFGSGNEPSKEMCDLIFPDNFYTGDAGTTKSLVLPIYDESGYGRNATKGASSTLDLSTDTTRYDYSTVGNGSSYIQVASPTSEAKSASFWVKFNDVSGSKVVFVDYKSRLGFGIYTGSTRLICSAGPSGDVTHDIYSNSLVTTNTWYHIVIVNPGDIDSTSRKLYINGVLQTPISGADRWTHNVEYLQVLGRSYNTANELNGLMSDFRLYAKALTDEDVLDLYENSATVDNFGNLHCYEAKETAENLFTFENLQAEASGTISITTANGEKAMVLPGNSFGGSIHHYFDEKFQPNTQYKFDIFIDGYGASNIMGMQIRYTDGTYSGSELYDRQYTTQGYKHKVFYSNASKSIDYFTLVNPNSGSAYYRTDSVIIPMDNPTNVENKGIVNTGYFREDTTEVSIGKGDNFDVNNLIEK